MRSKLLRAVLALLACAVVAACAPPREYVRADAEDYLILGPYTVAGIEASAEDPEFKQDLLRKHQAREFRIRMAGGFEADQ